MLFDRLSGREKVLVLTTIGAIIIVVAVLIGISVNLSLGNLEDRLETKRDNYERILSLKNRYVTARRSLESVKKEITQNKNTLMRDIGGLAQESAVEIDQISQSKGAVDRQSGVREESVKVQVKKLELGTLLAFLQAIEKRNKLFFIRSISMRPRFDDRSLVDASFNISTLVPLED